MAALDSVTAKHLPSAEQRAQHTLQAIAAEPAVSRLHELRSKMVCSALYCRLCSPDALIQRLLPVGWQQLCLNCEPLPPPAGCASR